MLLCGLLEKLLTFLRKSKREEQKWDREGNENENTYDVMPYKSSQEEVP